MNHLRQLSTACFLFTALLLCFACGGGGGGDSGTSGSSGIQYTGLTSPALITEQNASDLALSAYEGYSGSSLAVNSVGTPSGVNNSFYKQIIKIASIGSDYKLNSSMATGAVQSDSETVSGPCGGRRTISLTIDDVTGDYSGSITFDNYCDGGDVTNGTATVSGKIDLVTESFFNMNLSTNSINVKSGSDSITFKGQLIINYQTGSLGLTMTLYMRDDVAQKVFWIDNFTISAVDGGTYIDVTISGRFYQPNYGYVDLTTTNPIRQYDSALYPSSGILIITGASNTKAQLVFLSSTSYKVMADTNGDNSWEWDSGTMYW